MPFLFVQLANFGRDAPNAKRSPWAELRDAQLHTLRTVPRTGMAVTIDVGNPKDIHPKNKQDVGKRLALWALATEYGKEVVCSGPLAESHRIGDGRVTVTFEHVGGGLSLRPGPGGATGFEVAGADGVFRPARAKVEGKGVVVWSDEVPAPVAARYAWKNAPVATLFNREGLPASPFKTK
jgi:sialate O-acetylesterase